MKDTCHLSIDWVLRVLLTEKARGILCAPDKALWEIYQAFSEEQKIAFLLAGGIRLLPQCQQIETGSDIQTDQLPVLC